MAVVGRRKAIIRTSRLYAEMRTAESFGAQAPGSVDVDFPSVMEQMRRLQTRISRTDSARRLGAEGVDVYFGEAHFAGPRIIAVDGKTLHFKKALIATGARPMTPAIPGLAAAGYLTNANVLDLIKRPRRLLVIGGGPLGCELAQAFCRLGSHVIIAQNDPMFLPGEERDAAQILSDAIARDGLLDRGTSIDLSVYAYDLCGLFRGYPPISVQVYLTERHWRLFSRV